MSLLFITLLNNCLNRVTKQYKRWLQNTRHKTMRNYSAIVYFFFMFSSLKMQFLPKENNNNEFLLSKTNAKQVRRNKNVLWKCLNFFKKIF